MTIYLDLLFFLNFSYDFLLLLCTSTVLKRFVKIYRVLLGSLIGALSIFLLFLKINGILLFILKILVSILMILITFKYKNIKYTFSNLCYLYMCSIILAGFLYFLDLEFSYKHEGIIFYFNGLSINYIALIIIAPLILGLYIWQIKKIKTNNKLLYKVIIILNNNKKLEVNGYIDTGNKLKDPITKKKIIIIEQKLINKRFIRSPIYVPYTSINYKGLLLCFSPKEIIINNHIFNNYLLGLYDGVFNIENANCILHSSLMEEINV